MVGLFGLDRFPAAHPRKGRVGTLQVSYVDISSKHLNDRLFFFGGKQSILSITPPTTSSPQLSTSNTKKEPQFPFPAFEQSTAMRIHTHGHRPTSVKIHRKTIIRTRHIICPRPPHNIRPPLPHLLILPLNRRLIRSPIPVPHRRIQRPRPIRLIPHRSLGRPTYDIVLEAVEPAAPVGARDRGRAVAALLQGDVPVCAAVVVGADLEFDPGGGELGAALDAAFKGGGEGDEEGVVGVDGGDGVWAIEVGACGAVAVPVVVVEGELLIFVSVVAQDDAWAADLGGGDVLLGWEDWVGF